MRAVTTTGSLLARALALPALVWAVNAPRGISWEVAVWLFASAVALDVFVRTLRGEP